MGALASYLWRVICGAVICAVVDVFTEGRKSVRTTARLLSGIYLAITVLSPITDFSLTGILDRWDSIHYEAVDSVSYGEEQARIAKKQLIKESLEAYILKKAASNHMDIQVSVTVSEELMPVCVTISGRVSPVEKRRLQQIMEDEVGIPKEHQVWN